MGGHPTVEGMALLPDRDLAPPRALHWADLAGHLRGIWRGIVTAAGGQLADAPESWGLSELDGMIEKWASADQLYMAIQILASRAPPAYLIARNGERPPNSRVVAGDVLKPGRGGHDRVGDEPEAFVFTFRRPP
jgi:hypothetical protein